MCSACSDAAVIAELIDADCEYAAARVVGEWLRRRESQIRAGEPKQGTPNGIAAEALRAAASLLAPEGEAGVDSAAADRSLLTDSADSANSAPQEDTGVREALHRWVEIAEGYEYDAREAVRMRDALRPYWMQQESMTAVEAIERLVARVAELEAAASVLPSGGGDQVTFWKTRLAEETAELRGKLRARNDAIKAARRWLALEDPAAAEDTLAAVAGDAVDPPTAPSGETGGGADVKPRYSAQGGLVFDRRGAVMLRIAECGDPEHAALIVKALNAAPSPRPPASSEGEQDGRSEAARMLAEFEGHPNSRPTSLSLELTLHREEHAELQRELELGDDALDRAHLARELADVTYLAYRSAHVHGIDLDAALREIHRAAMDKIEVNVRRSDGKILKPPGFVPPDMSSALLPAPSSSTEGGEDA